MALTDAQRNAIVEGRLAGRSIREVATDTGHAMATVHRVWHLYLAETAQARLPALDLRREELLQRLERNAADARAGAEEAAANGDHGAASRYLAGELSALRRIVELEGLHEKVAQGALVATSSVEAPLPWKDAVGALASRVAGVDHRRRLDVAVNRVIGPDPFLGALQGDVPTPEELAPVAVEHLQGS